MKTLTLALLLLVAPGAFAQEVANLPSGFKVINQNPGHWITTTSMTVPQPPNAPITVPPPPQGKLPPAGTTITEVTRSGQSAHIIITDFQGKTDRWCVGKVQFVLKEGWNIPVWLNGPGGAHATVPYVSQSSSMFPELAWVSPATFVGVKAIGGGKCFAFSSGMKTAYFDATTLGPIMLVTPDLTYVYKILPPPPDTLTLPPQLQVLEKSILEQEKPHTYKPPQA